jgi:hypothetical protein
MRFAIRDDDTNFFTSPAEIEYCYAEIWDICPPSLSLISHVKGNWRFWVDEIYSSKHHTDWVKWRLDNKIYPISENNALVSFLRRKNKEGKLDLTFHAIHHRNEDDRLPNLKKNNYIYGAEFFTNRNLTKELGEAVKYLQVLFDTTISVFTPPQNLLSLLGYRAVISNKLNIVGGGIPFWKKEKGLQGLINIKKQLEFKIKRVDYPYILNFKGHKELIHHYPLQPTTRLEYLIEKFNDVYRYNGDFIISTHYIEFERVMIYDHNKKMKEVFYDFLKYVQGHKDVNFVKVSDLF